MDGLQDSYNIGLQIICPANHQNFEEINDKFGKSLCRAASVFSINDFGDFYFSCLNLLRNLKPDIFLCVGDRFETMAAATAALLLNIPIAHIHGGECTTGAFDNEIRNSITQMATYHFAATEQYAKRVADMTNIQEYYDSLKGAWMFYNRHKGGYYPFYDLKNNEKMIRKAKIYNTGSPGLDWLHRTKLLSKQELQQYVNIDLNQPFIVACLHPETKELPETERHVDEFMKALERCSEQILLIGSNIDPGNDIIYERVWRKHCDGKEIFRISNLDHVVYLSLLQYTEIVIGNSSSGIIEVSSFNKPVINIGNRQTGRIKPSNVIDVGCSANEILDGIQKAKEYSKSGKVAVNPYGDGNSSNRIINILKNI
jgi:UDP-N-acetylglucosamine 2-epimerase